jgi:hypothetical protein
MSNCNETIIVAGYARAARDFAQAAAQSACIAQQSIGASGATGVTGATGATGPQGATGVIPATNAGSVWTFTGDGSTTTWTLTGNTSGSLVSALYLVHVDGVVKAPANYTINNVSPRTLTISTVLAGSSLVVVSLSTA